MSFFWGLVVGVCLPVASVAIYIAFEVLRERNHGSECSICKKLGWRYGYWKIGEISRAQALWRRAWHYQISRRLPMHRALWQRWYAGLMPLSKGMISSKTRRRYGVGR